MLRDRDIDEAVFSRLDTWVVRKSPDRYGVTIPANIVYNFIDEMSDRVDRGLRVSEGDPRGRTARSRSARRWLERRRRARGST